MSGRDAILGTIRRGLARGPLPAFALASLRDRMERHPRNLIPGRAADLSAFAARVEASLATIDIVTADAVPAAIAGFLVRHNLSAELTIAPNQALRALPWSTAPLLQVAEGPPGPVAVQEAYAGVAETGTLIMPSGPTRPTLFNLLPDTQIVVLRADRVVGAYEDAWDLLRADGAMPRTVMFVTGPSRSADIEQTLELGAHGPRRLHVVLIEPCAAPS